MNRRHCYLMQNTKSLTQKETKLKKDKTKQNKEPVNGDKTQELKLTKTKKKAKYNKLKCKMKQVWTIEMDSEDERNENMSFPSHFKQYTIQDRKVVVQQPIRTSEVLGKSYDGPENAKRIDLAEEGEEPRLAYIATNLEPEEEELLIKTLKQYKDVFAWSYKDLKGVDLAICQHTTPMKEDAKPCRQRPYTYNDNFAKRIKEEIDKLMAAKFIYEIEHTDWVSPIVVVPKKNGKLRVCVNLKKVNAATIRDNDLRQRSETTILFLLQNMSSKV